MSFNFRAIIIICSDDITLQNDITFRNSYALSNMCNKYFLQHFIPGMACWVYFNKYFSLWPSVCLCSHSLLHSLITSYEPITMLDPGDTTRPFPLLKQSLKRMTVGRNALEALTEECVHGGDGEGLALISHIKKRGSAHGTFSRIDHILFLGLNAGFSHCLCEN